MFRQIVTPALRTMALRSNTGVASRMYHDIPAPPGATMDDLPVPSGSWEAQYKVNQTKYNMHLGMGILFFGISLLVAKSSGLLYLNYSPPALPQE